MIRALCTDLDRSIIHEYLPFTTVNCGGGKKGIAHTTLEIMEELQNFGVVIILATTRRLANFQKVKEVIPHHFAILEDGGVIIDKESAVFEKEWMLHLQPWKGCISVPVELHVVLLFVY
ncbi:MAG: hypothetical protein Q8M83_06800 [bacterium]|nr:hypothetical protein [bacterium]